MLHLDRSSAVSGSVNGALSSLENIDTSELDEGTAAAINSAIRPLSQQQTAQLQPREHLLKQHLRQEVL